MNEHGILHPQLTPAAQHLLVHCRITAETDPDLYRSAVRGRSELAEYFRQTCDWTVEVSELAQVVRLHKRRDEVPTRRGPFLQRANRRILAEKTVMVLAALVCEQLWRHQRIALRDLLQSISQVCAAETTTSRLPVFRIVAGEGVAKAEAAQSRLDLLDALRLLLDRGLIEVDADLDRSRVDESIDLVISANRERLALEFASLSPALLRLDRFPIRQHAQVLSAPTLLDADRLLPDDLTVDADATIGHRQAEDAVGGGEEERARGFSDPLLVPGIGEVSDTPGDQASVTGSPSQQLRRQRSLGRRQRAVAAHRCVLDDPGFDPTLATAEGVVPYLQTSAGRERALTAAHSVGLVATVRRDWWQVDDPAGAVSLDDFPRGRRAERQGALALLDLVIRAEDNAGSSTPYTVTEDEIVRMVDDIRRRLPRWARGFAGDRQLRALARAAADELVMMALLEEIRGRQNSEGPNAVDSRPSAEGRVWRTTPGIYLWKVSVGFSAAATATVRESAPDSAPAAFGAGGSAQGEPPAADPEQPGTDGGSEAGRTDLA